MHLDLENCRLDLSIVYDLPEHGSSKIADSDVLDETITDKLFHSLPCLLVCDSRVELHFWLSCRGVKDPLNRVATLNRDIPLRNGEMNQVQIELIHAKIGQCFLASGFDMFRTMVSVPKFRHDEKILASANTLVDGALDTSASLLLV